MRFLRCLAVRAETEHTPTGGVAETLLHETAGRELLYGDLAATVATAVLDYRG